MGLNKDIERTILIIDDSKTTQQALKFALNKIGYTNVIFGDGVNAIELIQLEKPDIVFLDIYMPGISGLEILQQIKVIDKNIKTPFVIMTSLRHSRKITEALELGANDYLIKNGLSTKILLEKIQNVLNPAVKGTA